MPDDSLDLDKLKAGDAAAWVRAYARLWTIAFYAARGVLRTFPEDEANDMAITAVGELSQQIQKVNDPLHLERLLKAIAFKRAVSRLRYLRAASRDQWRTHSLEQSQEQGGDCLEGDFVLAERLTALELAELLGLLQQGMSALDERTRAMLNDHHMHGLSQKELAAKYGLTQNSVGSVLSRGLDKVSKHLKQNPRLLQYFQDFLR